MKATVAGALVTLWALLIMALSFGDSMADSRLRLNQGSTDPAPAVASTHERSIYGAIRFPRNAESLKPGEGGKLLFHPVPVRAGSAEEEDQGAGSSRLRVQEPATLVFLGVGFLVLAGYGRRLTHRTRK